MPSASVLTASTPGPVFGGDFAGAASKRSSARSSWSSSASSAVVSRWLMTAPSADTAAMPTSPAPSTLSSDATATAAADLTLYYDDELERMILRDDEDLLDPFSDPQPGMAAVFRVMSTILLMLAAEERSASRDVLSISSHILRSSGSVPRVFDSRRLWRIAMRLKVVALDLNRAASNPRNLNGMPPNPTDGLFAESTPRPAPVSPPTTPASNRSSTFLDTMSGMVAYATGTPAISPSSTVPQQSSKRTSLWRQSASSSFLSFWNGSRNNVTAPPHRNPTAFLSVLENVKAFVRDSLRRDLIRVVCCRTAFEERLETVQSVIVSWAEEVGNGIRNRDLWARQDESDKRHDFWMVERVMAQMIALQTGDKALLERLRRVRSLTSLPLPQQKSGVSEFASYLFGGSGADSGLSRKSSSSSSATRGSFRLRKLATDDTRPTVSTSVGADADDSQSSGTSSVASDADTDEEPFDLLPLLRIEPGVFIDAERFVARMLAKVEENLKREAENDALFGAAALAREFSVASPATDLDPADGDAPKTPSSPPKLPIPLAPVSVPLRIALDEGLVAQWMQVVSESLSGVNRNLRAELGFLDNGSSSADVSNPSESLAVNVYDLELDVDGGIPLGPAGFGETFKAVWRKDANGQVTNVVVKRLRGRPLPKLVWRDLEQELKKWSRLPSSPHVAPLLGYSTATSPPLYVVPPYTKHGNLLTYTLLHPGHALRLIHETTLGLLHLHQNGIIHGSLHAGNVLVDQSPNGAGTRAVVTDMGMASVRHWLVADGICRAGWRRWTAPEVLRTGGVAVTAGGHRSDVARWSPSDVYSFAMTCYEVVSGGRAPFYHLNSGASTSTAGGRSSEDDGQPMDDLEQEHEISRLVIYDAVRPTRPPACPELFWSFITQCWKQDSMDRPTFATIEGKLREFLKLQNRFRRQSQIKALSEAFVVEVPLNDLMESVAGVGAKPGASGATKSESEKLAAPEPREDSGAPGKISMNLKFSLDGIVGPPHPASQQAFGIDLPPDERDEGAEDNSEFIDSLATLDDAPEWASKLWTRLNCEPSPEGLYIIDWPKFTDVLRRRYPTLVAAPSLRKLITSLVRDGKSATRQAVTLRSMGRFLAKRLPPNAQEETDLDLAFSFFCLAADADTDPTSAGPASEARLREMIVYLVPTWTAPPTAAAAASPLHLVMSIPIAASASSGEASGPLAAGATGASSGNGAGESDLSPVEVHLLLLDALLPVEAVGSAAAAAADARGWTALHLACKLQGGGGGRADAAAAALVLRLLQAGADPCARTSERHGSWAPLHVAAWVGQAAVVEALLLPPGVDADGGDTNSEEATASGREGLAKDERESERRRRRDAAVAMVAAEDAEGWTPVAHAARYGHAAAVELLARAWDEHVAATAEAEEAGRRRDAAFEFAAGLAERHRFADVAEALRRRVPAAATRAETSE
ncbi:hypothetical protein HK405_006015 [Cladochytrium tenue]|nr:hypothetical protein HK405_006015 [Cladochytrium tenue]